MTIAVKPPRGIRNNNPGNIDRRPGVVWQGMSADQSTDPRFVVFEAPEWGIRAIAKILLNYQRQHKLTTVRQMIGRWAPPNENDTNAYAVAVARALGVAPDDKISLASDRGKLVALVAAIIRHENGMQPYSLAVIAEGVGRALA